VTSIPIQNIYYLLCYAWDKLTERDLVSVESIPSTDLVNLFARVLINGTRMLLKCGLDRGYEHQEEWTTQLRGRIDFAEVACGRTHISGKLPCQFDEMTHNVLHNRILKSTIALLINTNGIDRENADILSGLLRHLADIEPVKLNGHIFNEVRLNRNNRFYEFLICVCEIVYRNLLVSENTGKHTFREFVQDEDQMPHVFEAFIRNFYRIHAKDRYKKIGRERIYWQLKPLKEGSAGWLPKMETDVTLTSNNRKVIVECKYTADIFQHHFDNESFRSKHMYQVFSYIRNLPPAIFEEYQDVSVFLLYPTVTREHSHWFTDPSGCHVGIHTINLAQSWTQIHDDLLALV